ncbi:MAG: methionyl-tRNA formyltransferase [Bacteroidetes bacterium]|nr:MAG: methionyl-tRNA formyltransferase [Bacteroidota bacterium]
MTTNKVLEYNTERKALIIKDYGRNVQKMADFAKTIEDKKDRTKFCHYIVQVMAKDQKSTSADIDRTLWDHLHIISNFELDVDAPYPIPSESEIFSKPEPLSYKTQKPLFKQYGKNIESIIQKTIEEENEEQKAMLTKIIANHMKKLYLNWNRESVSNELIIEHLQKLSNNQLVVNPEDLISTNSILSKVKKKKPQKPTNKKKRKRITRK